MKTAISSFVLLSALTLSQAHSEHDLSPRARSHKHHHSSSSSTAASSSADSLISVPFAKAFDAFFDPSTNAIAPSKIQLAVANARYKTERNRAIFQFRFNETLLGSKWLGEDQVKDLLDGPKRYRDTEERMRKEKRQVATDPLTDDNNVAWHGPLSLGTPAQNFQIDFDTGSADLWVPSTFCVFGGCANKNKYNSFASRTNVPKWGMFSIKYGDGSTASGPITSDKLTIAGVSAPNQYFGSVTSESASFGDNQYDGIGGMAFQSLSQIAQPTFFDSLVNAKAVKQPVFAFRLTTSGSVLHLGGTVQSSYKGAITYTPVTQANYWTVSGSATVNGKKIGARNMIIDTGTTLIIAPPADAKAFWAAIPGSAACSTTECGSSGLYTFPCNAAPKSISFTFGGRAFPVLAEAFNLGPVSPSSNKCVGGLIGQDLDVGWIVGDVFLRGVYAVFDKGAKRVGFATPA